MQYLKENEFLQNTVFFHFFLILKLRNFCILPFHFCRFFSKQHKILIEAYASISSRGSKDLLQNQSLDNDNIFDLVLFISSGVFIIFILDIFVKNIKRF